jgi:hypothetical protein
MDERLENFKKLLKEVEKEYFENRNESDFDKSKLAPFKAEMDTVDLVGDQLVWLI